MSITKEQIERLMAKFSPDEIEFLPKGGRKLAYVSHQACTRRLIEVFGGDWSFEIVETRVEAKEVAVLGRLTCAGAIRMQWGGARNLGDLDDTMKAAGSYSLKKCASLFGIGLYLWDDAPSEAENQRAKAEARRRPKPSSGSAEGDQVAPARVTKKQLQSIGAIVKILGWSKEQALAATKGKSAGDLTAGEADALIMSLQDAAAKAGKAAA